MKHTLQHLTRITKHYSALPTLRYLQVIYQTQGRVFDVASQSINNSQRNSKQKFTEFYDN